MGAARDPRAGSGSALSGTHASRLRRWLRPPRTLRPTRAGWIFFALTFGVAFAALNTGNNLLYLMLSLMLAFLCLSGVFSEAALRGIVVHRRLPAEIVVGRPAPVELEIQNRQRRVAAFAVVVEDRVRETDRAERPAGRAFVLRVEPGATRHGSYRLVAERRGRAVFPGFRVSTRFPFGLFQKSRTLAASTATLFYPALGPAAVPTGRSQVRALGEVEAAAPRHGSEAGELREFVAGDSARRIHWRASLRRSGLVVRDTEDRDDREVEVRLRTRNAASGTAFEQAVSRAASEAATALEEGLRVGLRTDDSVLPSALGAAQRRRLLRFLARVEAGRSSRPGS